MGKGQLIRICFKWLALPGGQEVEGVRLCSPLPLWQPLGRLPFLLALLASPSCTVV